MQSRLAQNRNCLKCGTVSSIPPKQQAALIAAADTAVNADWLANAVKKVGIAVDRVPNSDEYYGYDRYLPGNKVIELP